MEFKPINTQEEFNAAISERMDRREKTIRHEYDGWLSPEAVETRCSELTSKVATLEESLAEANNKITGHTQELADRDAKIKALETNEVKARVCRELGLPHDAVSFITGADEEAIRENANVLKGLVGNKAVPPLADPEKPPTNGKDEALKKMLRDLNA